MQVTISVVSVAASSCRHYVDLSWILATGLRMISPVVVILGLALMLLPLVAIVAVH
jgi:hypothetical protein